MDGVSLRRLLKDLIEEGIREMEERQITGICYDSRQVNPGGLFVAIPGTQVDGHRYIPQAIARGAVAIVAEKSAVVPPEVAFVKVDNARQALAILAASFYGEPSHELVVIGITGTNGKTTTAYLIEAILQEAGYSPGVIGTINYRYGGQTFENPVTTPESLDLMRILREMVDAGVSHAILEVSSHALDLERVASCAFDVGVFTNLSQDHLDYHKDMETYWQCKKRLCIQCLETGPKRFHSVAVVNRDDPKGESLTSEVSVSCFSYGLSNPCQIRGEDLQTTINGIQGIIHTPQGLIDFSSPLVGRHNIYNVLSAVSVATALKVSLTAIKKGIDSLHGVPGRLEPVPNTLGFSVFVDYAHTPDALENVLTALRPLTRGRLITVFGCGGDRDKKKRPFMGKVVARLSDFSILTSDNPRSESPEKILQEIEVGTATMQPHRVEPEQLLNGFVESGYVVEVSRGKAIALSMVTAQPGDTVLIAGKGHETYQIIADQTIPFDDRLEAKKILKRLSETNRSDG